MPQRSIRFSDKVMQELKAVSSKRGFASATAFIRYAVQQELSARQGGFYRKTEETPLPPVWNR